VEDSTEVSGRSGLPVSRPVITFKQYLIGDVNA